MDKKNNISNFLKSNLFHYIYSIDHNGIFDHMYCTKPGNLLNIYNIKLKYQNLIQVVPNFREAL